MRDKNGSIYVSPLPNGPLKVRIHHVDIIKDNTQDAVMMLLQYPTHSRKSISADDAILRDLEFLILK